MRIYILTDLEGPAGVNLWAQTREGDTPLKREAMHLLTQETNAAIEGILQAAPESEIFVLDGHGSGGLLFEELHSAAQVFMHGSIPDKTCYIDAAMPCDALMFVGQHAMAGVPDGPLCHTFSSRSIEHYKLNGELIGETGCIAARFGERGVPTIFLAGDHRACEEAETIIPGMVTVATKKGLGVQYALHLSAHESRRRIREGAAEAIGRIGEIEPYRVEGPYELEIRVLEGVSLEGYLGSHKYEQVDDRTVLRRGDNIEQLFD
jgi:D-amino peptidase